MSKQTAVEWLVQEISSDRVGQAIIKTFLKEFEQAKAMEKEQHYESYRVVNCFTNSDSLRFEDFFAEYYNQTYGGDK